MNKIYINRKSYINEWKRKRCNYTEKYNKEKIQYGDRI